MAIRLRTPAGADFEFDIDAGNDTIVITTRGGSQHAYRRSALRDLYQWLRTEKQGEWVVLGTKGEEEVPNPGTVEEWARAPNNPVHDFYGVTQGRQGRFASYIPSILAHLGFAEITSRPMNNEIRAI